MSQKPGLRFDHREIAVVFSLFVFVSLLMFTVGILVGKGLAQAKFDAEQARQNGAMALPVRGHTEKQDTDSEHDSAELDEAAAAKPSALVSDPASEVASDEESNTKSKHAETTPAAQPETEPELELIPLGPQKTDWNGLSMKNQKTVQEAEKLLENPKIKALTEDVPRQIAAVEEANSQNSFPVGPFTVQVGSYPTQNEALERVNLLKSLGFAHAYFSAKDLGDSNGTWFRVWLGYFPNYESARKSGDKLQARGEVKNYLIRKTEASNGTN
jgi:cell division protein FtsN